MKSEILMKDRKPDKKIYQIALLVSLACILQISESMIPHPIPGLRLGLANMLTLTALVILGLRNALEIAVMRTILGSLMMGTFMSPTFILSFSSAIASTLAMGLFHYMSGFHRGFKFSIIGISIVGAFTHNMVQLYLAYLILVKHPGIFVFLPWLSIGAVATGWVVGVVTGGVCRGIQNMSAAKIITEAPAQTGPPQTTVYVPLNTPIHRIPSAIKILAIMTMALVILAYDNLWLYVNLFIFLSIVAVLSQTRFSFLFSRVRKFVFLIGLTFLLPVLFNSGTDIVVSLSFLHITREGVLTGGIFALRVILLIMASALLMKTTSPREMTKGLSEILSPLKIFGISDKRTATVLSLSWSALPYLWDACRQRMKKTNFQQVKSLRNLIPLLSGFIADMYLNTESDNAFWETIDPETARTNDSFASDKNEKKRKLMVIERRSI